jgi:tetratricopeptide (TPR) repeat protein
MKRLRTFLALGLVAALSTPCVGFAQSADRAAPRVRDALSGEALDAFDRAREHFANGRYADARAEFERAHTLSGDARVLYNVAVCDKELGRYARAAARLRQSLATTTPLSREYVERARGTLELLAPYVGPLRVEVSEPGASVSVDGEDLGALPTREPLEVDIGRHVVTAWREGFYEASQAVDVPREAS